MIAWCRKLVAVRRVFINLLLAGLATGLALGQAGGESHPSVNSPCRVEPADYKGWQAQKLSNRWVQLLVLPQNGGRLIQIIFAGHPYFFVNPKYEGKYLPPSENQWFNYGGDKLWLLPEGNDDEQHWVGNSDLIDDGVYSFRKISEGERCEIELTGPADPRTGIQFQRTIQLDADSPRIRFHATMKNTTGHTVEWSMQSVSQYDTADPGSSSQMNHNFRTFAPANPVSSYLNRYHVRFGPAENPAISIREDGLFALRYVHMAAELWLDSTAGWLAVVDGNSKYSMVERFQFEEARTYPGKASIIFWTNGPEVRLNADGEATMTAGGDGVPYYLEAEINSPLCRLRPGDACSLETEWFPARAGNEFHGVSEAGTGVRPLRAISGENGRIRLSGSFGAFFPGRLVAHFYTEHGAELQSVPVADVDPAELVVLETEVAAPAKAARISLHLEDWKGLDRGSLQEVSVGSGETR
ncbi:MAG TPA: hypothetical protein VE377_05200 [Candidatus Dormibacteraeota bacterium]|nr:hypothetical protein [Candidatus Dormibacteraeota bacterium]